MELKMKNFKKISVVPFLLLVIILGGSGYAKLYKYKDENGVWRFTDSPVTDEQVSESMEESAATANVSSRDLLSQLLEKIEPKNDIEKASMATIGIQTPAGFGSGFFVTNDGYILTNKHVLKGSEQVIQQTEQDYQQVETEIENAKAAIRKKEAELENVELELEMYKASLEEEIDHNVRWAGEDKYNVARVQIQKWKTALNKDRQELAKLEASIAESEDDFHFIVNSADFAHHFTIFLADNSELYVNLIKVSDQHDLALLKLDGYKTPVIETLKSDQLPTGERVFAIGNPVGLKNSVAAGIMSGHENGFVKTDAKIYPGNSGSPLVDKDGRVVGINTMKLLTRNFEGLGFAIPIETALAEFQPYLPNH